MDFATQRMLKKKKTGRPSKKMDPQWMRLLQEGTVHQNAGRFSEAKACYQAVIQGDAQLADPYHLLAQIALHYKNWSVAEKLCEEAFKRDAQPLFLVTWGDSLRLSGRHQEARAFYERAQKQIPQAPEPRLGQILSWMDQKHYDQAQALLDQKRDWLWKDERWSHLQAHLMMLRGEWKKAYDAYQKMKTIFQGSVALYNNLGVIARRMGQWAESRQHFEQALQLQPQSIESRINLAALDAQFGDHQGAIAQYQAILKVDPHHREASFYLAREYVGESLWDRAEAQFSEHLQRHPDHGEAWGEYAALCVQRGYIIEALAVYFEGLKCCPNDLDLRQRFIHYFTDLSIHDYIPQLEKIFLETFALNDLEYEGIIASAARQLRLKYNLQSIRYSDATRHQFRVLLEEPLFWATIRAGLNRDADFEWMLMEVRKELYRDHTQPWTEQQSLWVTAILSAVHWNEYVWPESPEECHALDLQKATLLQDNDLQKIQAYAMYRPLIELPGIDAWASEWRKETAPLWIHKMVLHPMQERALKKNIPSLGMSGDRVSEEVRAQYEEHPYPRWSFLRAKPITLVDRVQYSAPHYRPSEVLQGTPKILIAGCGTGKHPIMVAKQFPYAEIVAIDLSLSSLAYAVRKAQEANISNIRFIQADILKLPEDWKETFHWVESAGVIHHMRHPEEGLQSLVRCLKTGGILYLGLYSTRAREIIVRAREKTSHLRKDPTLEHIRASRQDILRGKYGSDIQALQYWRDFYSASEYRDLVLHIQEHTYTPLELDAMLQKASLKFLGFLLERRDLIEPYRSKYPNDPTMSDLKCWDAFEAEHPEMFRGMLQFYVEKH